MKYRPRAEQLLAEREPLTTDLFWAAGFLEGEGTFAWNKAGTLAARKGVLGLEES